ncbi:MAG: carboxypeptidase-like regulatory domain-containing protein [Oscillospiraceae bacterium]|nr:carboxypeptidase-like regulatory domain-containing protein [Oscillospiraceae bacterium]
MGTGYLRIQATTADGALPVADAEVTVMKKSGTKIFSARTDENGKTEDFPLPAPPKEYTLCPYSEIAPASISYVSIKKHGFISKRINGIEILDTQTSILPVNMIPLTDITNPVKELVIDIPPGKLLQKPYIGGYYSEPLTNVTKKMIIHDYITIHLGKPDNKYAENIRVTFMEYIENVASGELNPNYPHESLLTSIDELITLAANRICAERYRSRGCDFDIDNSAHADHFYREGGHIYERIRNTVRRISNIIETDYQPRC